MLVLVGWFSPNLTNTMIDNCFLAFELHGCKAWYLWGWRCCCMGLESMNLALRDWIMMKQSKAGGVCCGVGHGVLLLMSWMVPAPEPVCSCYFWVRARHDMLLFDRPDGVFGLQYNISMIGVYNLYIKTT